MKFKRILAVALAVAVSLSVAGCGAKNDSNEVVLGGIGPLTGELAMYGTAAMNGAQLYIDENPTLLEKNIRFITLDDKGDSTESLNAYNKLMDSNNAVALIGAVTSKPSAAVAATASSNRTPMITPTGTALEVTTYGDNIFRACYTDPFQGKVMAQFTLENLGAKKAAIIYNVDSDYSGGLAASFEETLLANGGELVAKEGYSGSDKDFMSQLTNIASKNPEVLFIPDYYSTVALIAKQVKDAGINATLLGADGWDSVHSVVEDPSIIEGAYFCNHYSTDDKDPLIQNFVNAYNDKYSQVPNAFAALGYDAAGIMTQAIARAGSTDKEAIIEALKNTDYTGVTGHVTFDENGDPIKSVTILKIENGQYVMDSKLEPSNN